MTSKKAMVAPEELHIDAAVLSDLLELERISSTKKDH